MNKSKGFTLFEIIVVLIILGVLAAIALPSYFNIIERTNAAEAMIDLKNCREMIDVCIAAKNDTQICANDDYTTRCSSEKFFLEVSSFHSDYLITAMRHDAAGAGVVISNDVGGEFTCPWMNFDVSSQRSGFVLCHENNGTTTIKGWGFYQGM